ncbi:uncharacterized protein BDR25DRAFT_383449 [Lindgomyces ingoldianus]|uniref:Uncharacterized protein n=1 Tax=Lindgomyces ingoldianus TaxID=673940 RepID=A0ACB6QBR8_9PLEO|nr:uncharacterized protein BDR25DRAFT_383449 [Lindgomyces ingoldianus]KAF2463596.1 hypothetical protein BDR25DRAFT_383449 [Lindgomyces ingoldianus]
MQSFLTIALLGLASISHAVPMPAPAALTADIIDTNANNLETRAVAKKRGLAFNDPKVTKLFKTGNSKVSWMYNWASSTSGAANLEFVPMLWGKDADHTSKWAADVEKYVNAGTTHAMSFNEPDQCGAGKGGACMQDVAGTIAAYKKWMQPLSKYGDKLKLGAPAVTNGVKDATTGSIMGLPWLKQFLAGCTGCKIDFIAIHWYDSATNIAYFKKHVQDAHAAGGNRPVWITEFAPSGSDAQIQNFLKQVLPWLDSQDYVTHYAYQWAAPGVLVNGAGNGLSAIGNIFNSF